MEYKWLNNKNNSKIIVFFNGWGMDENIVKHLEPEDFDVLMFYDYNNLVTDFDFKTLDKYTQKYLIAWSMGVMTATLFDIKYDKKIAINGTLKPIDNKYGIPVKIYDLTLKGLTKESIKKFTDNMFSEPVNIEIGRNFENQKSELLSLISYNANENFKYDKVIISSNDKIFPTKNQTNYWNINANLESGHAPFKLFKYWSEIL